MIALLIPNQTMTGQSDFCVFVHFFSENFVILFTVEASSNITIFNEIELFQTRHICYFFPTRIKNLIFVRISAYC